MKLAALIITGMVAVAPALATEDDPSRVELTPQKQAIFTKTVRGGGYECPQAKIVYNEGLEPEGVILRVYCGPEGREGVFEKLVYKVTLTPRDTLLVAPWRD